MSDVKFTATHEWLKMVDDTTAMIGITHHAQQLLGDMVFVELPALGSDISAKNEFGVVESVKAASDVYAPISGTVTAINEAVIKEPSLVNTDPQGLGWLIKIKLSKPDELTGLLNAQQYSHHTATEE